MLLDEFCRRLERVTNEFPIESEAALENGIKTMRKALQKNTPKTGKDHKHVLSKSWKMEVDGKRADLEGHLWNEAPHFHLVERGHVKMNRKKQPIGFVQGRFFCENTVKKEQDPIIDKMHDRIYKAVNDKL